jgi:adenylosuccinate synthase
LIDGQFGSTGKGLIAGYIGKTNEIHYAVSNASANAGHTYREEGKPPIVAYHLPMTGIVNKNAFCVMAAGSIIDPEIFEKEIRDYGVDPMRVIVSPRAAVIEPEDQAAEAGPDSQATRIGSTRHGVGAALVRKIQRRATLAGKHPILSRYCKKLDLNDMLQSGARVFLEIPQGYSLGLNSSLEYPYCTSREISIAQGLADAQINPRFLGTVTMTLRTFPIRVGNIVENGKQIGYSGPFYPDSQELSWEELGVEPEITTVTKRVRRVATFSIQQYQDAIRHLDPDFIFLNFVNYFKDIKPFYKLLNNMMYVKLPTHFGIGPYSSDIYPMNNLHEMASRLWGA